MFTIYVRKLFRKAFGPWATTSSPHPKPRSGFRPRLEVLEDRIVPASFLVTNLNDAGDGSLRAAIGGVNGSPDNTNTINFAHGVQPLNGTIALQSALPAINNNVTISGPGGGLITVEGNASATNLYSIFVINQAVIASINGLTITYGYAAAGGGINNSGSLTLQNDEISNNKATQSGGGIYNGKSAELWLLDDYIALNNSSDAGGGIYNAGSVGSCNTDATEIAGNTAKNSGGGIYNSGTGTMDLNGGGDTIRTNTVNSTSGLGGGIYNCAGASFTITNGTISNNQAYVGGGLYNNGTANLYSTNVENNKANQGADICLTSVSSIAFNTVTVSGNSLIGTGGKAAGVGYLQGAQITNNGLTDNDDPGGNPVQLD